MEKYIRLPKISEILFEEFMLPFGLSAYKLAQEIHVPVSRIQDILHDRRKITADTSIRLGKFFGVSDKYFLALQDDIDIRNTKIQIMEEGCLGKPEKIKEKICIFFLFSYIIYMESSFGTGCF